MNFRQNATIAATTQVLGVFLQFMSSIVLARFLVIEEHGQYQSAIAFASIATLLSQFGWNSAVIYRLQGSKATPQTVAGATVAVLILMSVMVGIIATACERFFIEWFMVDAPRTIYYLSVCMVPALLFFQIIGAIARGIDRFSVWGTSIIMMRISKFLFLYFAIIVFSGGASYAMAAVFINQIAVTVWLSLTVLRETGINLHFGGKEIKANLTFGLQSYAQNLAGHLQGRFDLLMIALLLRDPAQVALYAVAIGIVWLLQLIPEAIGEALFPKIAGMNKKEASQLTATVMRHVMFVVIFSITILSIFVPLLLPVLYSDIYEGSVIPLLILLPSFAMHSIYRVMARYFMGTGRQFTNILSQFASLSVKIPLNFLMIPRYGIAGAAFASLISYILEALIISVAFRRATGVVPRKLFLIERSDFKLYKQLLVWPLALPWLNKRIKTQ